MDLETERRNQRDSQNLLRQVLSCLFFCLPALPLDTKMTHRDLHIDTGSHGDS